MKNIIINIGKYKGEYKVYVREDVYTSDGNFEYVAGCYGGFNNWTSAGKDKYVAYCRFEQPYELDEFIRNKVEELKLLELERYNKLIRSLIDGYANYTVEELLSPLGTRRADKQPKDSMTDEEFENTEFAA